MTRCTDPLAARLAAERPGRPSLTDEEIIALLDSTPGRHSGDWQITGDRGRRLRDFRTQYSRARADLKAERAGR